jgi:hypothetical protein
MNRTTAMRVASALAEISTQTTHRCKEDYLYEIVSILDALSKGEKYTLFARSTGADPMRRFTDSADIQDGIADAKRSLGVDLAVVFCPDERYEFMLYLHNVGLDKSSYYMLKAGLDARGIHHTEF